MADFPKLPRLKVDDEGMERLHAAARKGQTDEVRRLIETGISAAIANRFGCTALHLACKFGQVVTAEYLASVCTVQTPWHGQLPLHLAVMSNKLELVRVLVDGAAARGEAVDSLLNECDALEVTQIGTHIKHCDGQTALHWCVGLGEDYLPMLELLLKLGASPTVRDKNGETPLMRAIEFGNDAALTAMLDGSSSRVRRLELADSRGRSHLHWAILYNRADYAERFIDLGADVNAEDEEHVVPLYLAIRAAMVPLVRHLLADGDPFVVQTAPFHNGSKVLEERVQWFDFVKDEEAKESVLQLLQDRLSELVAKTDDGAAKKAKKRSESLKRMKLAPSAPYRSRGKSVTRSK